MDFSEKLNFLFDITKAEGKALAYAMSITPPQISKMRKGIRGMPKNYESARIIAEFFAERCRSDEIRDALSAELRIAQIRDVENYDLMADILLDWFSDERNPKAYAAKRADDFLRLFGRHIENTDGVNNNNSASRAVSSNAGNINVYFSNEGRRRAVSDFLHYLIDKGGVYTINILTDENTKWVSELENYSVKLQADMLSLANRGSIFRRIVMPLLDIDSAFESLNRWLPLYMAGKASSYYYKRMRDSLNRITIFAVKDEIAMFSLSVGNKTSEVGATFVTDDVQTVNTLLTEFESYFSVCEPIMNVYSMMDSPAMLYKCMLEYESCNADCLQLSNSLSFITMPWEVELSIGRSAEPNDKNDFLNSFAIRQNAFVEKLKEYDYTDIIYVDEIDSIMSGKVPIPAGRVLDNETIFYTPKQYLAHLKAIVTFIESCEHYRAVVLSRNSDRKPFTLYIKESLKAILIRERTPHTVFEVSERYLVSSFGEYLRRLVPPERLEADDEHSAISELNALIEELSLRILESSANE